MTLNQNPSHIVKYLLQSLNINVSDTSLEKELENHPYYPSILAISDALKYWNIPHRVIEIDTESLDSKKLSYPFIAHTSINGGLFLFIKEIKDGVVLFTDGTKSLSSMGLESLLEIWKGVSLFAKKEINSGEKRFVENHIKSIIQKTRIPFVIIIGTIFIIFSFLRNNQLEWNAGIIFLLKLVGFAISCLLLSYNVNENSSFLKKICRLGESNGCSSVLNSDAAKVFTWLNWSEVGFLYFAGGVLSIAFVPFSLPILTILNLCCLPYSLYSIYYQLRLKSFCVLCCAIQLIFWLEVATFFNYKNIYQSLPNPIYVILILFCFLIPVTLWIFLKPLLESSHQNNGLKKQLNNFKYNSQIYNQSLKSQHHLVMPEYIKPIIIGNASRQKIISLVSNPYCNPCADAHKELDELMNHRSDLTLEIIILSGEGEDNKKSKVAMHLTALAQNPDKTIMRNALNDWYNQPFKNYDEWSRKYPTKIDNEILRAVNLQKQWCDESNIDETPTIFINGYKLPDPYAIQDLRYLID